MLTRCRNGHSRLDMVAFWKEVAAKAPHHSRASWMKFWRRHKHEYEPQDGDGKLMVPQPPEKKMRYSRQDDVLLARWFVEKHNGTSDQIFQAFAREVGVWYINLLRARILTCPVATSSSLEGLARTPPNTQSQNRLFNPAIEAWC